MHINLNAMGTRMKRRRKELKMSQTELAEKVNVLSRKLAEKPGVPASGQSENPQNQNDGVDWDKMMSLEHMKD